MPDLFTIGYEGRRIDDVITALRAAGVTLLIDVRAIAASRKPGFSKRQLAAALDAAGIAYVHLRGLGTPKAGRMAARAGRTAEMHEIFAAHMRTDPARAALAEARALRDAHAACLLCFEADPGTCHRLLVANALAEPGNRPIRHLFAVAPGFVHD